MNEDLRRTFDKFAKGLPPTTLHYVTPDELQRLLAEDPGSVFLLDNRTPEAYAEGHIAGSTNIWFSNVFEEGNLARLPRDRKVVVVCWVGHTASQLVPMLRMLGYDAVGLKYGLGTPKNPAEDKRGWAEKRLPTEAGGAS